MQILIVRDDFGAETILGSLSIAGQHQCHTREPLIRADRLFVPGESALAPDTYNLSVSYCARFRRDLPLLSSVYGPDRRRSTDRVGMRLHPGHPMQDTGAEILLGQARAGRTVVRTRPAFDDVMSRIYEAMNRDEAIEVLIR